MTRALTLCCVVAACSMADTASAHYMWLQLDATAKPHGVAQLHFEEGPRAGKGEYLDRFLKDAKLWIRTPTAAAPTPLELSMAESSGKRWLSADLPSAGPRVISSYGKFGVYTYGNTNMLLHYYARRFDVASPEQLEQLARARHLNLDIVPRVKGDEIELQLIWKGKPAAGRPIYVRGGGVRVDLKTDANGKATFKPGKRGQYTLRTYMELDEQGQDGGQDYQKIRHWCTAVLNLPL